MKPWFGWNNRHERFSWVISWGLGMGHNWKRRVRWEITTKIETFGLDEENGLQNNMTLHRS